MTQVSDTRTHLPADGTSQQQRRLDALKPAFVKIDERGIEDFLVFALRLADRIKYYDLNNSDHVATGKPYNWQPFFTRSTSVIIAKIRTTNPLPQKRAVSAALSGPNTHRMLQDIFDGLISLARTIDQWEREVDVTSGLKGHIGRLIEANLSNTLGRLVSYERAVAEQLEGYEAFDAGRWADFGPKWNLTDPGAVSADASLFGGYESGEEQIASAKNRLEQLFLVLYNTCVGIIQAAPRYFDASVDERGDHEPHIALFLTFLKLYLQVRDDTNRLTTRHLDFYYEKVLGLTKKSPEPDHVHLLFAPAKSVFQTRDIDAYKISKGRAVDAGKDATGVNRIYTLDDDLVANLAQIESLRTIFVDYEPEEGPDKERRIQGIYAAPVANSGDGTGGDFEDIDRPVWPTLGSNEVPAVEVGFAVASRELLLAEGKRTVTLTISTSSLPKIFANGAVLPDHVDIALSGEKEWIDVVPTISVTAADEENILQFEFTLESNDPPVVGFDAEALDGAFGTPLPVMRVLLNKTAAGDVYQAFRDFRVEDIMLETSVESIRDVVVQNDLSLLDATKAFQPFGPQPTAGTSFYVGSAEAFRKHLTSLSLHITWEDLPANFSDHYRGYQKTDLPSRDDFEAEITMRNPRVDASDRAAELRPLFFTSLGDGDGDGDGDGEETDGNTVEISLSGDDEDSVDLKPPLQETDIEKYGQQDQEGFLQLTLKKDFLHGQYASVLSRQLIAAARYPEVIFENAVYEKPAEKDGEDGDPIIPREPYTPSIKDVHLSYKSAVAAAEGITLIHVHPFEDTYEEQDTADAPYLVPRFGYEGALFLGIENLKPLQSLSILFQAAEGTADPDLEKAEIRWHYLTSNEWKEFEDYEIIQDTTNGLIASGIVTFAIPRSIDRDNTVLPSTLHWIRASVKKNTGAVSELIGVHTQAVRATFSDQENDPGHLKTPLPAETVTGLLEEDAAVAGVEQPYPSFGGHPAEKSISFYTRVSERLRHKGRAITRFDYERLVLEEYPEIYKLKCIKHTNAKHERAPGQVLVAVIPDFTDLNAAKRREPKVTLATLDRIKTFLESANSPFVRTGANGSDWLHVLNPVYEKVRVSFAVKFKPSVTAISYHVEKLKTAIVQFLSPWAYEREGEISFGGKLHKSTILNFVEEQSYVEYLTDFQMMHGESDQDVNVIEVTTPRSILVPAIPADHVITPITSPYRAMEHALNPEGIGAMTLWEDFRVVPSDDSS